eukprot:TRINITY_DN60053_c1_g1_i1.p2 TRINITY_DN60053_c1_g1~~TRINITY_DN60053_c1_g1_i1.p2  ORF type:complete len:335 (+),score=39.98 TRINITY_DN60053_c1_g1_i1:129-1007(+)
MDAVQFWIDGLNPARTDVFSQLYSVLVFDPNEAVVQPVPNIDPSQGRFVGGVQFEYYSFSNSGLVAYIAVDDAYRGKGVGRKLMQTAFETLQKQAEQRKRTTPPPEAYNKVETAISWISRDTDEKMIKQLATHFTEEDIPYLLPAQSEGDASSTVAPPLRMMFAETHRLGAKDNAFDPATRHKVLSKIGYGMLDFDFVQPPLDDDAAPCADLLLLAYSNDALKTPDGQYSAFTAAIKLWILEYMYSCHFDWDEISKQVYAKHMLASLSSKPPTITLNCDCPTWTRRTVLPEA